VSLWGTVSWEVTADGWGAAVVVLSLGMAAVGGETTVCVAAEEATAGGEQPERNVGYLRRKRRSQHVLELLHQ